MRKVEGLLRVAADPGASPEEAASARAMAEKMKAKHGIEDAELVEVRQVDLSGLFSFFGPEAQAWSDELRQDTDAVLKAVDALCTKIAKQRSPHTRADSYAKLWKALKDKNDGGDYGPLGVKQQRDLAVYHAYQLGREHADAVAERHGFSKDPDTREYSRESEGLRQAERAGGFRSTREAEPAVRRGRALYERELERVVAKKPCVVCGKAEGYRRAMWTAEKTCESVCGTGECFGTWRAAHPVPPPEVRYVKRRA